MSQATLPLSIVPAPTIPVSIVNLAPVKIIGKIAPVAYATSAFLIAHAPNGAIIWADVANPIAPNSEQFEFDEVAGAPANTPEGGNWQAGSVMTVVVYYFGVSGPGPAILYAGTFTYAG